jgi:hypothetical protein
MFLKKKKLSSFLAAAAAYGTLTTYFINLLLWGVGYNVHGVIMLFVSCCSKIFQVAVFDAVSHVPASGSFLFLNILK